MKINLFGSWLGVCFVLQILLRQIQSAAVVPTWTSTPYLKSDTVAIRVDSILYSTANTTATATFSTVFPTVPSLTFGLRKYRGKFINSLGDEDIFR
jgi:hypothetical protein